jgi:hypothetical protein
MVYRIKDVKKSTKKIKPGTTTLTLSERFFAKRHKKLTNQVFAVQMPQADIGQT